MRITLVLLPLALTGAPAFAQAAAPAAPAQPVVQLPPVLADPATADRLADTLQSLSSALLNLPVGEVQAAIEGRKATAADRRRTVRSETGISDRELQARIAAAKPQVEQSIRAVNQALPEISADLQHARQSLERALANMPDPNYPRR